jgi:hypothetical protein
MQALSDLTMEAVSSSETSANIYQTRVLHFATERRGRVVNTSYSYSGGPGFNSRPWRPAILIKVINCFPQSMQVNV